MATLQDHSPEQLVAHIHGIHKLLWHWRIHLAGEHVFIVQLFFFLFLFLFLFWQAGVVWLGGEVCRPRFSCLTTNQQMHNAKSKCQCQCPMPIPVPNANAKCQCQMPDANYAVVQMMNYEKDAKLPKLPSSTGETFY